MIREVALFVCLVFAVAACSDSERVAQKIPPVVPADAPIGTVGLMPDPQTGQVVTKHVDDAENWRTVDTIAVMREPWGIPPDVDAEDFDLDSVSPPPEPSDEEMSAIVKRHYSDWILRHTCPDATPHSQRCRCAGRFRPWADTATAPETRSNSVPRSSI